MKIIEQSHEILTSTEDIKKIPFIIEKAGRTCYKSESKITSSSAQVFCKMLIKNGHEAMIEHGVISVRFITDRGVTHELVRHRIASFAQESTRYVKYNENMEFIKPVFSWMGNKESETYAAWKYSLEVCQCAYITMIGNGAKPQEARAVLPNSLKTEIVVTANIREWRQIFKLRTAKTAHPQIKELMIPLLHELCNVIPELFNDILL